MSYVELVVRSIRSQIPGWSPVRGEAQALQLVLKAYFGTVQYRIPPGDCQARQVNISYQHQVSNVDKMQDNS